VRPLCVWVGASHLALIDQRNAKAKAKAASAEPRGSTVGR
jgi:hypothetical protein